MDRRTWLNRLVMVGSAAVAGILVVPAAFTALSPTLERRPREDWRRLGLLEEFPIGGVRTARVDLIGEAVHENRDSRDPPQQKAVFVWRSSEDEVIVYSRNCTDLSCPLTWDDGSGWFVCPCHGGIFTIEGKPVAGPPDRPMYRYDTRVRDGVLEIDVRSLPPIT